MPSSIAALLTAIFIVGLFLRERTRGEGQPALWVPVLWIAITGSKFVSQWLSLSATGGKSANLTEGSPLDAFYFGALIVAGVWILAKRRVRVASIVRRNRWLFAFFLYSFLSILWSDFPDIALKRFIKALGHPIIALIILSDESPTKALQIVAKRCAYLLVPLSILFIKYFPEYGRGFDDWTGFAYNNGVMNNKNELGYVCMLLGIFFVWNLLVAYGSSPKYRVEDCIVSAVFLAMIGWLLYMANSSTSVATTAIGVATLTLVRSPLMDRRRVGAYTVVGVVLLVFAEWSFGLYEQAITLLGRDPTLTDRTELWADTVALVTNPIVGAGFESFWLGSRLDVLWAKWWWRPNQAHSGYIETYLNLGVLGVILLIGVIVVTFRKITRQLRTNLDFASLRLGLLFAILFYNYSEAALKGVHLVWTFFYIIALDYLARTALSSRARAELDPESRAENSRRAAGQPARAHQGRFVRQKTSMDPSQHSESTVAKSSGRSHSVSSRPSAKRVT